MFHDTNNNGLQDPGELPYTGALVRGGPGSVATSRTDGRYDLLMPATGNDTLRVIPPIPYAQVNPLFYPVSQSAADRDFGIYFPPGTTDLRVHLTHYSVFRPGFSEQLGLTIQNRGTEIASGQLRLILPAAQFYYQSAEPAPASVSGDTLVWNFQDLPLLGRQNFKVTALTPAGLPLGSMVSAAAVVTPQQADAFLPDNEAVLTATVVGSYDPNDKRVEPSGNIGPTQAAARIPLTYTVRFQNTGTFFAERVRITDTLDARLDPSSFQLLAASHPCTVTLRGAGIVEFLFEMIYLPDSTSNEAGSHGFVTYSVRPKPGLTFGNQIANTAHIYFDFNPAITTNTVITAVSLIDAANAPVSARPLNLYPNPAQNRVYLECGAGRVQILQPDGKILREAAVVAGLNALDIRNLPAGNYAIRWLGNDGSVGTGKVIVVN